MDRRTVGRGGKGTDSRADRGGKGADSRADGRTGHTRHGHAPKTGRRGTDGGEEARMGARADGRTGQSEAEEPMHIKLHMEASTGISSKTRLIILMPKNYMTFWQVFEE